MKLSDRLRRARVHADMIGRHMLADKMSAHEYRISVADSLVVIARCEFERLRRVDRNYEVVAELKRELVKFLASRDGNEALENEIKAKRDRLWCEGLVATLTPDHIEAVTKWLIDHRPEGPA